MRVWLAAILCLAFLIEVADPSSAFVRAAPFEEAAVEPLREGDLPGVGVPAATVVEATAHRPRKAAHDVAAVQPMHRAVTPDSPEVPPLQPSGLRPPIAFQRYVDPPLGVPYRPPVLPVPV